jgi:alpha-L-rhamnosidase
MTKNFLKVMLIVISLSILMSCNSQSLENSASLEKGFVNPPESARIWVYWFWLNGNLTKEGMTADLEAMKRAGVGGVLIMEVDQGAPVGPVAFMSDKWRELFKHMVSEAQRLGLEVNMNNDAGWNGSGGPWVPLDKAMQVIVTSEMQVPGGKKFEEELPKPLVIDGFYRDIAVLAFPTPMDPTNLSYRIENLSDKGVFPERQRGQPNSSGRATPDSIIPPESVIARGKIVDLTAQMDGSGKLTWEVPSLPGSPSGEWTIIRFGHTFTGAINAPAPATGTGPECDKLSKEGVESNYNGMMAKLVKDVGSMTGKTLVATHVDSWEIGGQNWTPKMREEFKRLRGYDMMPFMPVMTGRIVDNLEISERFLRDVRQTVSDLVAENYIGHLRKLANEDGLKLSMEAYTTPANDLDVANFVDEPICEFWWPNGGGLYWSVKAMASAAHVNGLPIVGAEAFTANNDERFLAHPANIKALGDRAFCDGVNRFIVHRYAMQPWVDDRRPGMTMGPWGLHYERTQTWWEDSKAWHEYVARCQYLLRQGMFVADVLNLQSEEPMKRFTPMKLSGYDYDAISPQSFLKNVTVKSGVLELPSGMKYRLLVLPDVDAMTPQMLEKIEKLVENGATVVGKPPVRSPGLSGYPECDAQVKRLVEKLWGTGPATDRKVGKGRVVAGKTPSEVLTTMGIQPDFNASQPISYIHRVLDEMDVYFVANSDTQYVEAVCNFRVSGKTPEAWYPETGRMKPISVFEEADGCTRIPLRFEPSGSMFIVFRKGKVKASEQIVSVKHDGQELVHMSAGGIGNVEQEPAFDLVGREISQKGTYEIKAADGKTRQVTISNLPEPVEIKGPWEVKFAPGWGAPEKVVLDNLVSWSEHSDNGVKYFSGAATYRKTFDFAPLPMSDPLLKPAVYLDLGKVAVMAGVKLNGKDLGVLWKPPYRVDISDAVKAGENVLEVRVVNLLINRMIGDELLPEDSERKDDGTLKKWPQWLQDGKSSPTGRFTFTSWRLWKKNSPLQESGLLGPVIIVRTDRI